MIYGVVLQLIECQLTVFSSLRVEQQGPLFVMLKSKSIFCGGVSEKFEDGRTRDTGSRCRLVYRYVLGRAPKPSATTRLRELVVSLLRSNWFQARSQLHDGESPVVECAQSRRLNRRAE